MKRFDDDDLIAYHLGELSARRASDLEHALAEDAALAAASEEFAATLRVFKPGVSVTVDEEMLARNWNALRPSLLKHGPEPASPFRWYVPALAAVVLLAAMTGFVTMRHRDTGTASAIPEVRGGLGKSGAGAESARVGTLVEGSGEPRQSMARAHGPLVIEAPDTGRRSGFDDQAAVSSALAAARSQGASQGGKAEGLRPRVTSLALAEEPVAAVHFIPLASTPLPALPAPPLVTVKFELPASAEDKRSGKAAKLRPLRQSAHHVHETDVMLAMGGTLIGARTVNTATGTTTDSATHAISGLAAFHQQLRPLVGYRVAFSYTRPDFLYDSTQGGNSVGQQQIDGKVFEVAATYVVRGPHVGILSTSAEAGGGLMVIAPYRQSSLTGTNVRPAAVAGVAADIAITKHIGLRAAYRMQWFKGPDFQYSGPFAVVPTSLVSKEPMLGITYRFSNK